MKFSPNQFDIQDGGYYGPNQEFGGRYVPEILLPAIKELEDTFYKYKDDPDFLSELEYYRENLIGRKSPLIFAENLTNEIGGAKIYFKNEGNNFTGSHKINHCVYQILLAKRMGKKRVICETGAGQHGLATAIVCAKFGLECTVHMGRVDMKKQYPNVFFMKQVGAKFVEVTRGNQRLTEAADSAMADFINNPDAYLLIGSVVGPHPYPEILREAQKIVGQEIREQLTKLEPQSNGKPNQIIACIGGGSNAIGAFNDFLYDESVELIGVEAAGKGIDIKGEHASRIDSNEGRPGIMEGFKSTFLFDELGQVKPVNSISAGLGYVGIGPIHAYLHSVGRLKITSATDQEVMDAFKLVAKKEGLIVALESLHAVVETLKQAKTLSKDKIIVVNLSGRGDNYLFNIASGIGDTDFQNFCNSYRL